MFEIMIICFIMYGIISIISVISKLEKNPKYATKPVALKILFFGSGKDLFFYASSIKKMTVSGKNGTSSWKKLASASMATFILPGTA